MKFTEDEAAWLRAALAGKTVQYRKKTDTAYSGYGWTTAVSFFEDVIHMSRPDYEVRIKPNVIIVNGLEVPAPEKEAPRKGTVYYVPGATVAKLFLEAVWISDSDDIRLLERGLVFMESEHAIAMAEAMLAYKPR